MKTRFFWLVVFVCFYLPAHAQLHWENQTIELTAKPGQKVVRTAFKFTNPGKSAVTILGIKPSCGCVATALEKMDYKPGEGGEIQITFDAEMDDVFGLQEQKIEVTTSDAPDNPTVLLLNITVPETIDATPQLVVWNRGDKPEAKETVLEAGSDVIPIKLSQTYENNDFAVQITPEIEGQRYRIKITPKTTEGPCYAQLEFKAESKALEHPATCRVNVGVK